MHPTAERPSVRRRVIQSTYANLKKGFLHPPAEFHTVPFWSLNAELDDQQLIRQIHEMHRQGIGGFFLHARLGLEIPYLSSSWLNKIRLCVDTAKSLSMAVWIYDEDQWPSGMAGGLVAKQGEHYRSRALECRVEDPGSFKNSPEILKVFVCEFADQLPTKIMERSKEKIIPQKLQGKKLLVIYRRRSMRAARLNGGFWVDLLQAKTTDAFIGITHEAYKKAIGDEFGRTVKGFFTDEPAYLSQLSPYEGGGTDLIPWTEELPQRFYKRYGYRYESQLPCLFFDIGDYMKVRFDFYETLALLFVQNYTSRLQRWCTQNNLKLTGHFLHEESTEKQIRYTGNCMLHALYLDIPGIDHLGRSTDNIIGAKQIVSVSHQLRRERTLSEMYGMCGWGITFAEQKWIADWHFALGINMINPHLFAYSIRGYRKRDFPPSLFVQQPWWPHYKALESYLARASFVLSQGEFEADILVLGVFNAAWPVYKPSDARRVQKIDENFKALCTNLYQCGRSFDIGDQRLIDEYGRISNDKLLLGKSKYGVIVIPSMPILKEITVNILFAYMERGGRIVAVQPLPTRIRGGSKEKLERLYHHPHFTIVEGPFSVLKRTLDRIAPPRMKILSPSNRTEKRICQYRRTLADAETIFLVNSARTSHVKTRIVVKGARKFQLWNLATGEISDLPQKTIQGSQEIKWTFHPGESMLLVRRLGRTKTGPFASGSPRAAGTVTLKSKWTVTRLHPNALTLDYCRYCIGDAMWSAIMPVWKANEAIRDHFHFHSTRHNRMASPWTRASGRTSKPADGRILVEFPLSIAKDFKPKKLFLVCEPMEALALTLNNKPVDTQASDGWIDPGFRRYAIAHLTQTGNNVVGLSFNAHEQQDLEAVYIQGDFLLKRSGMGFTLYNEAAALPLGDWTKNGYPFYAGALRYTQAVRLTWAKAKSSKVLLEMAAFQGAVAVIHVNGKQAGVIGWHPMQLDISRHYKRGNNEIAIDIYSGLRNLFGPHHLKHHEASHVGPGRFSQESHWTHQYHFVPQGLCGSVKLRRLKI